MFSIVPRWLFNQRGTLFKAPHKWGILKRDGDGRVSCSPAEEV